MRWKDVKRWEQRVSFVVFSSTIQASCDEKMLRTTWLLFLWPQHQRLTTIFPSFCAPYTLGLLFFFFFCWSSQLLRYFYIPSISNVLCSPVVKAVWPVCWYSVESKENQESVGGRCRKERVGNLIRKRLKVSCLSSVVMATDAKWAKKTRSTTTKTMLSLIDSCVCVCVSTRTCFLIFTTDRHDLDDDIRSKGKEVRRCRRRRRWRSVSSTQRF